MVFTILDCAIFIGIVIGIIFIWNFVRVCICRKKDPLDETIPIINGIRCDSFVNISAIYTI